MNHWQRHKVGLDINTCLGQVATSDSVGQVATSDSVGQVATGDSVGQVATGDSVGQVATSDSVGQVHNPGHLSHWTSSCRCNIKRTIH